jgi:hypothetical protein
MAGCSWQLICMQHRSVRKVLKACNEAGTIEHAYDGPCTCMCVLALNVHTVAGFTVRLCAYLPFHDNAICLCYVSISVIIALLCFIVVVLMPIVQRMERHWAATLRLCCKCSGQDCLECALCLSSAQLALSLLRSGMACILLNHTFVHAL